MFNDPFDRGSGEENPGGENSSEFERLMREMRGFGLRQSLEEAGNSDDPVREAARVLAADIKPKLDMMFENGMKAQLSVTIQMQYSMLDMLVTPYALAPFLDKVNDVSRADVHDAVAGTMRKEASLEDAYRHAEASKNLTETLSEEQFVEILSAIDPVIPPRTKAFLRSIAPGRDFDNVKDEARHIYRKYRDLSVEDLAQERFATKTRMASPEIIDAVTDAIVDAQARFTPEAVIRLKDEFTQAVDADVLTELVNSGLDLAKSFVDAAADGRFPAVDDPEALGTFTGSLAYVLETLEDSATEAGLAPDMSEVQTQIQQAFRP